jgi:hypothetical protein
MTEATPEWLGEVYVLSWDGGPTRFALDAEGDAALFCSDSERLLTSIRGEVARLNKDRAELERVMAEAESEALECFPNDQPPAR